MMNLRPAWTALAVAAALTLGSCGGRTASRRNAARVALSELPFAELSIPPNSRPGGAAPADEIPLNGPFRPEEAGTRRGGKFRYVTALPFRPRGMFFVKPQGGATLHTAGGAFVPYDKSAQAADVTWAHDRKELRIFSPSADPPTPGQFVVTNAKAAERERALNLAFSPHASDPAAFAWAEIADGWDTRRGLLLPAPGIAAWEVDVPRAGELTFVKGLVEPEILDGPPSDGALLVVEVEVGGQKTEVFREPVAVREFAERAVDLSPWAGQRIRLRLRSEPGASARYDYVFAGGPIVASRVKDPVRVVLVYLDTVRPDHLGLYGYERDTSMMLDAWASDAAVFTQARSVAPWTLPSARALITGRQPEDYLEAKPLPELLHARGWPNAMIAGNVYLMANFQMQRGWDLHRIDTWPPADQVTDQALAWLGEHPDHDVLLQVQYMSAHLPYVEPEPYLHLYAEDMVRPLKKGFLVQDVRKANAGGRPDVRQYITDRYDNNVRFLTDSVRRIVDELDGNDWIFVFSDHGEELWDHDGFEHGHTLYDELLRVPLIIDGPGVEGARIDAPVSLLDLAPTILDALGEPIPPEMVGRSLLPLLRGETGAAAAFAQRDQAFGRPLYGFERWGVLHQQQKWTVFEGRQLLFDLPSDPGEQQNLLKRDPGAADPFPGYLDSALGRQVVQAYRLVASAPKADAEDTASVWVLCTVPGGFSQSFLGTDALENSRVTLNPVPATDAATLLRQYGIATAEHPVPDDASAVEICWEAGWSGTREAYLLPKGPLAEADAQMVCSAYHGGERATLRPAPEGAAGRILAKAPLGNRTVTWTVGTVPLPPVSAPLSARDSESTQMLIELGYLTAEQAAHVESSSGCAPPSLGSPK